MTPAAQCRAALAAYMRRYRARCPVVARQRTLSYMTTLRTKQRQQRAAELHAMPSLTLPQVVEWLRLRALLTWALLTTET